MIDLHIHTTYSDGTDTVKELLEKAENKKLDIISITDHDSIDAYFFLAKQPQIRTRFTGKIITVCEFKTFFRGTSIEILGYNFDYQKIQMPNIDNLKVQMLYLDFFKSVLDKYHFVYDVKELYIDFNDPHKHYAGLVLAKELLRHPENKGLIEEIGVFDENTFFRIHQCNKNSIFYIDESLYYPEAKEIIRIIHEAGGLAFLAHPYLYNVE